MKLRIVDEMGFALDSITCDFLVYDQREKVEIGLDSFIAW